MHKKIESELVSIAHSILQMKNRDDVLALKAKAGELYEKLSVLAFVDRYVEATPGSSKDDILEKAALLDLDKEVKAVVTELEEPKNDEQILPEEKEVSESVVEELVQSEELEKNEDEVILEEVIEEEKEIVSIKEVKTAEVEKLEEVQEEAPVVEDLFSTRLEEKEIGSKKTTLAKELEGTISLDVTTDLFENAVRVDTPRKSLNDVLVHKNLQIGLNDRIAFVKHLFDGSQEDFNRVISQLNSFKAEKEAIKFVSTMVKADYDWKGKEEYEERFITLITRKFA